MPSTPITRVIQKVMPAVVSIIISKPLHDVEEELAAAKPARASSKRGGGPEIPEDIIDAHGMVHVGGGSGFLVAQNGIILTNKHVIAETHASYQVILNDNRKFDAVVLAIDPIDDIAILKIKADGLPIVALGDSGAVELGEEILAIGNALGLFRNTVSWGIISGLSRAIRAAPDPHSPIQEMRGLIQIDAAINPGNSGGPLVNMKGEAIGINAAIVYGAQNLSFALPINSAKRDINDLRDYGRIRRPLLGLRYLTIDEHLQGKMKLPIDRGALILGHGDRVGVVPGSPAHDAGILEHDIIIRCNNEDLTEQKTIQDFLETATVGDVMHLRLLRQGKIIEIDVKLSERK